MRAQTHFLPIATPDILNYDIKPLFHLDTSAPDNLPKYTRNHTSLIQYASSKEEKDRKGRKGRQEGSSSDLDCGRIVTTACRSARGRAAVTKTSITTTSSHNHRRSAARA